MRRLLRRFVRSDDGAVAIIAAIGLLALLSFLAFAADYGVFWTARGQTQSAADMAAMAAATSWAFDVPEAEADPSLKTDRDNAAIESAIEIGKRNLVWTQAPAITAANNITLPDPLNPGPPCPSDTPAVDCIKVDIYRDGTHGSTTLPVYFANLFGVNAQKMKATATAGVLVAGASDCLAPFALPDRWDEKKDKTFDQNKSKFQKYEDKLDGKTGLPKLLPDKERDVYIPPGKNGTGYKYTDPASTGKKSLKVDDFQFKVDKNQIDIEKFLKDGVKAKAYMVLEIPRKDGKESDEGYAANWASCNGQVVRIGEFLPMLNSKEKKTQTELNNITFDAVQALVDSDPNAKYDSKTGKVLNSNLSKNGMSPRIINVPLFDPDRWTDCVVGVGGCDGDQENIQIVNVVGFFVECDVDKKTGNCKIKTDGKFNGRLMPSLGQVVSGPPIDKDFSFLRSLAVVR